VYPTLFRIGSFEITSFGVLVALGALAGLWIYGRELARSGLPQAGADAALAGVLGGLAGAKLLWALEHSADEPFLSLLLSRGGMSWFGGFVGGVGTALLFLRRAGIKLLPGVAAA
jgi:phosphatidylglycerol---prolipoprotein diacylglyceryl transferase